MVDIIGDKDGIALWNKLGTSKNSKEIEYFKRLSDAAVKYMKIWFSDIVMQEFTRANQSVYQLTWEANNNRWAVTLFHKTDGIPLPRADRPIELDYKDIIIEEIK
jgi:hypothetical protein